MQMEATEEGADNTGAVNGSWSLDVSLESLNLMHDGTVSTEVVPMTLSGASGNQQSVITEVTTDTVLTQPSNIRKAVSSGEMASRVVNPPAMAKGSVGDSQPVAVPPPPGGSCGALMADAGLTISQRGGLTDFEIASAIFGPALIRRL
jgi:hypothetical protein